MDSKRLQQIEEIYHAALEVDQAGRATFLDLTCGTDADLRREIDSLLEFDETPENFIDSPPASLAADLLTDNEAASELVGRRIGSYSIRKLLGSGGMGVVFLADDLRLNRKVGLKLLHENLASDDERRRRFEFEARSASGLNHPNILTIFEFGETDGFHYLVTEYVAGDTLRKLISSGELSLMRSLSIAEQIAFALSSAHAAGIVHRDIKPENIMVRTDGIVKVLDFGLAKLLDDQFSPARSIGDPEQYARTRALVKTNPGMVMGTVSYMSPEQSRGVDTDARTDLWSLGAVLYEMLTGSVPFVEETMSDSIAAILTKEPRPLSDFDVDLPASLQPILQKALAKDRSARYQTSFGLMTDLRAARREIENSGEFLLSDGPRAGKNGDLATISNAPTVLGFADTGRVNRDTAENQDEKYRTLSLEVEKIRSKYRFASVAIIAVVLIAATAFGGYYALRPRRLYDTAFNKTSFEKVPIVGNVEITEISPDKRYLAYVQRKSNNETRLVLRQTENGAEKEILPMGISYVRDVEFSPDGNYFYYAFESLADSDVNVEVFRIPLLGGPPEKVVSGLRRGFTLSHDGRKIAFVRNIAAPFESKIISFDLQTKQETVLASETARDFESVVFSADGTKLGMLVSDNYGDDLYKLAWMPSGGGPIQKVSDTPLKPLSSFDWLSDGSGLLVSSLIPGQKYGQIYKVRFPQGELTPVTTSTSTFSGVSLSFDNSFMVARQTNSTNGLWEFDIARKTARQTIQTTKDDLKIEDVTAAGRLLVARTDNQGSTGFWLMDANGANERLLTLFNADNSGPFQQAAISADEKYCYYVSDNDVWRIGLDGSGKERLTNTPSVAKAFGGMAPDSSYVLFSNVDPWSVQKLDIASRQIMPVLENKAYEYVLAGVARDKDLIAYSAPADPKDPTKFGFFLATYNGTATGEPKPFVNVTRTKGFLFSNDGNKVYFTPYSGAAGEINDTEMAVKDLVTGKISKLTDRELQMLLRIGKGMQTRRWPRNTASRSGR